ncbi:MAG: ATP-dependent Clp protease adaptor ClpS [Anaerolineae bacterium]|nr:ATP-dependent Clp protease adaptor ClpS [Anaerolineae bacterium]
MIEPDDTAPKTHYNSTMNNTPVMLIADPEIEEIVEQAEEIEPPWQVIIHNDDVTPMDFVVLALLRFFDLDSDRAMKVMLTAHYMGEALVGVYPRDDAQRRVGRAHFAAALEGYPLTFSAEPVS